MLRPPVNTGLRLPATAKADLASLLAALRNAGENASQDDLVSVLLARAVAVVSDADELGTLGEEIRAHRAALRATPTKTAAS